MLLWLGFAILTAAVVGALIGPLWRQPDAPLDGAAADLAVYRDQLSEIDAERERGLFTVEEAQGAHAEVARRLINRAQSQGRDPARAGDRPVAGAALSDYVFYAVAGLIPALSIAVYLALGAPDLPVRPMTSQEGGPVELASVGDLVVRVEARLRAHPEDGQGWDVIAPVYLRLERYADAAHAYGEANRILGESAKRLVGFCEASLFLSNGIVTEDVRHAAERILLLEPDRIEARLWLALAKEQDGDLAGAAATYRELLDRAPPDAPWRKALADRLQLLSGRLGGEKIPQEVGPGADDLARAGEMSAGERARFVNGMVEGLAERLKRDGRDLTGWLKLVRAYKVMGRDGEAVTALGEARRNLAGDEKALGELDQLAKSLGLGS